MIRGKPAHLLRRHVTHRAQDDSRLGAAGGQGRRRGDCRSGARRQQLGEAEVQDLDPSIGVDEDVLRLEIAVHDAPGVRRGEALGDLARPVERPAQRRRTTLEPGAQALSVEELRHQVRRAVSRSQVVEDEDVGMIEGARRARLLLEAAQPVGVAGQRCRQHLERYLPAQPTVESAIDLSHPAGAERRDDLIGTETAARSEAQGAAMIPKHSAGSLRGRLGADTFAAIEKRERTLSDRQEVSAMSRTPLFRYLRRSFDLARVSLATGESPAAVVERYRAARISRRRFLGTSGAVVAGAALGCGKVREFRAKREPAKAEPREVAVVGAGIAGLTCAYRLHQAGVPVRVFEGQSRVGGRMWSLRGHFPENLVCELGGELVDSNHEALRAMCGELGLELDDFEQDDSKLARDVWFFEGKRIKDAAVVGAFRPIAEQIDAAWETV